MKRDLDREELIWAAGFFDGEGSTYVHTQINQSGTYKFAYISVGQKHIYPLNRFARAIQIPVSIVGPDEKGMYRLYTRKYEYTQHTIACLWNFLCPIKRDQASRVFKEVKEFTDSRPKKKNMNPGHGTLAMYKKRCKCPACYKAKSDYDYMYRFRKTWKEYKDSK